MGLIAHHSSECGLSECCRYLHARVSLYEKVEGVVGELAQRQQHSSLVQESSGGCEEMMSLVGDFCWLVSLSLLQFPSVL